MNAWPTGRSAGPLALLALLAVATSCSSIPMRPEPVVPVTGTVRDRDGSIVPYTTLFFTNVLDRQRFSRYPYPPNPTPPLGGRVVCDGSGNFSVPLRAGRYDVQVVPPTRSKYGALLLRDVAVGGDRPRLDLAFTGAWVRGHVYGPAGQLLVGARVSALHLDSDFFDYREISVAGGMYTLLMPPGRWLIWVDPGSSGIAVPELDVGEVAIRADTTMDFTLTGLKITGTVTGPGGVPMAGAYVRAEGPTSYVAARTDTAGAFTLYAGAGYLHWVVSPPPGQEYIAQRDFYAPVSGPTSLAFELSGVVWTATVRLEGSGTPVAGAAVYVASMISYYTRAYAHTDPAGAFRVILPPQAVYSVSIDAVPGISTSFGVDGIGAVSDSTLEFVVPPAAAGAAVRPRATAASRPGPDRMPRPAQAWVPGRLPRP